MLANITNNSLNELIALSKNILFRINEIKQQYNYNQILFLFFSDLLNDIQIISNSLQFFQSSNNELKSLNNKIKDLNIILIEKERIIEELKHIKNNNSCQNNWLCS